MKKEYQKPEVTEISLVAEDKITNDTLTIDDFVDGTTGWESSEF